MNSEQAIALARRKRRHLRQHIDDETIRILEEHFQTDLPAYQLHPENGTYCPIAAAIRDGQREVILYIKHQLKLAEQESKND